MYYLLIIMKPQQVLPNILCNKRQTQDEIKINKILKISLSKQQNKKIIFFFKFLNTPNVYCLTSITKQRQIQLLSSLLWSL